MSQPSNAVSGVSDAWLTQTYGALIQVKDLSRLLGFKSAASLRRARSTGRLPIRLFKMAGRRGWFAYAGDVGVFLRAQAGSSAPGNKELS